MVGLLGGSQFVGATGEEGRLQGVCGQRVHRTGASEFDHHRPAVVAHDAQVPEEGQQVGVVAVPEERLGIGAQELTVQVREDGDLVVTTDAGDHGLDLGVGERRVDVGGPLGRGRPHGARRRILHHFEPELVAESTQSQLVGQRKNPGKPGGRGDDGDTVAGAGLVRVAGCRHPASVGRARFRCQPGFGSLIERPVAARTAAEPVCPGLGLPCGQRNQAVPVLGREGVRLGEAVLFAD